MAENNEQLTPENLALIKSYYDKVIQLVRYNKAKDEVIERLSKENEHYRTGFNQWVFKPLASSVIDMRENCKRELAGMANREYTPERMRRNFGLLAEELDGIIIDNGGDITEDDVLYDGKSILKPYASPYAAAQEEETQPQAVSVQPEEQAAAEPETLAEEQAEEQAEPCEEAAAAEDTQGQAQEEIPTLEELLNGYQKQIESILADNSVLEATVKEVLSRPGEVDADNKFRLVYPVLREIYLFTEAYREEYCWIYEGEAPADDDPKLALYNSGAALKEIYAGILKSITEKLLSVLNKMGVSVVTTAEDTFVPTMQQMVKSVATENEADDRKIANYITDAYELDGKLIYRQKVDVYKFKKN